MRTGPVLAPSVPQVFLPALPLPDGASLTYEPRLLGIGRVSFFDRKTKKLKHQEELAWLAAPRSSSMEIDWESGTPVELVQEDLEPEPLEGARFGSVPGTAEQSRSYPKWRKALSDTLYRTRNLEVFQSPALGLISEPGESERDFRVRLADLAREKRDRLSEKLRKKYARRVGRLEDRIRRAQQAVDREQQQASGQKLQTAISFGATLLSALMGRKAVSAGTVGKATTTMRGVGRAAKEKQDVQRARQNVEALSAQLEELSQELEAELDVIEDRLDPLTEELSTSALRPRRSDVEVRMVALAWAPFAEVAGRAREPLWE